MVFIFSGDILKPLSFAHFVTLFAGSFNLVSAICRRIFSLVSDVGTAPRLLWSGLPRT
jgi:hypothetical protein